MTLVDRRTAMLQMGALAGAALLTDNLHAEGFKAGQAAAPAAPPTAPPTGPFKLPALPYAYEALEPSFDAETMHLHHDKHHQAYVNNLNAAVNAHPELQGKSLDELVVNWASAPEAVRAAVRNNGGGHANHSFWWPTLGKGGGWAWLVKLPDGTVAIESTPNQDSPLTAGHKPVLGIDVWEHAYYLKYKNVRADYVKAYFNVLNWDYVSGQFAQKA